MQALDRLLAPLRRRVALMVGRAIVSLVDDGTKLQSLQVTLLADEVRDNVERFQQYGVTSCPKPGAEAIAVCVGGSRDHVVVIAVDDRRYRLVGLQPGEVALYDDQGQCVHLTRDGIVINGGGKPITVTNAPSMLLDVPLVQMAGDLDVDGNINAGANIVAAGDIADQGGAKTMAGMRVAYNGHHHGASPTPDMGM